jgi:hypothetical protein
MSVDRPSRLRIASTRVARSVAGTLIAVCLVVVVPLLPPASASTWPTDLRVPDYAPGDQFFPDIASLPNGTNVVVWEDRRSGTDADVYAQLLDPSGNRLWAQDYRVNRNVTGEQTRPAVAADPGGNVTVAWRDDRAGADVRVYAQRIDPTGSAVWGADDARVSQGTTPNVRNLDLALDRYGATYVVWEDYRGLDADILGQKLDHLGVAAWGPADVVVSQVVAGPQTEPTIDADPDGYAVVAWTDARTGERNISAQMLDPLTGSPFWGSSDVPVNQHGAGEQREPSVALTPGGDAVIAWTDGRGGTGDVFAQSLDATGTPQWGSVDVLVNTVITDSQDQPSVAVDLTLEAGDAVVVWSDRRSGAERDVYAQKLDASGARVWTSAGVRVNENLTSDQQRPVVDYSPGYQTFVVVWEDSRDPLDWDIYAQALDESGVIVPEAAALWPAVLGAIGAPILIAAWRESGRPRDPPTPPA